MNRPNLPTTRSLLTGVVIGLAIVSVVVLFV